MGQFYSFEGMKRMKSKFDAYKINYYGSKIQLFKNGSIVILGLKSENHFEIIQNKLKNETKLDISLKIVNIVCKFVLSVKVNIPDLYEMLRKTEIVSYNPELCRGLVLKRNGLTVILHHTGTGIITGCTLMSTIEETVFWLLLLNDEINK